MKAVKRLHNVTYESLQIFCAPESEGLFMPQVSPDSGVAVLHPSGRRWKKGDRDAVGRLFWRYNAGAVNGMYWVTEEEFKRRDALVRERNRKRLLDPVKKARSLETSREFQRKRRLDPEYRRFNNAQVAKWRREVAFKNPAQTAKIKTSAKKSRKKQYAQNAEFRLGFRMRTRIKRAVKRRLLGQRGARAEDKNAVCFLLWLAARRGIKDTELGPMYHIDHLIPVSKWGAVGERRYAVNSPENVQWLTAEENAAKADTLPSDEQVQAHLSLVEEWRASLN